VLLGESPRKDYLALAAQLGADILDLSDAQGAQLGRIATRLPGGRLGAAIACGPRLADYDVVFSDNERVGIVVGLRLRFRRRRPRHIVLAHYLTPRKKWLFVRLARPGIDRLIVHCEAQAERALQLGFSREQVIVLPYQVDTEFWWRGDSQSEEPLISTAGLECRDYVTFVEAVTGLPVKVEIGAASNWSRKPDHLAGRLLPENVSVDSYSYTELRDVYARSSFVVVPLLDVDFQAGITLILEAMSMGRATIVTRSVGQRDVVLGPTWIGGQTAWPKDDYSLEEATGIYISPGDVFGLRSAIQYLLNNPDVASRLGTNGRRLVKERYSLEDFAVRFATAISAAANQAPTGSRS
jgi:glycosyltransferase involved in cell wall biosynthesis